MTNAGVLTHQHKFPFSACLDRKGNVRIRGLYGLPARELRSDEGCRNLVEFLLRVQIKERPVLVTFWEACKLHALAWLLADLGPDDPMWVWVVRRFSRRSGRAARLWGHTTIGFDCAATAVLFRALVFKQRSRGASSNRVVIDHPDIDVLSKATGFWRGTYVQRQALRQLQGGILHQFPLRYGSRDRSTAIRLR